MALAGVVQMLAQTTENLLTMTGELRDRYPMPWVDTNGAVEHLPLSKTALLNSEAPRHYPTSHPVWNLDELDEWMRSC